MSFQFLDLYGILLLVQNDSHAVGELERKKRRLRKRTEGEDVSAAAPRQQTDGEVLEELFGDVDI